MESQPETDTGLPTGWELRHSNSKAAPYYYNASRPASTWEPPPGTNIDALKAHIARLYPQLDGETNKEATPHGKPNEIRASHILIKHEGSRNPRTKRVPSEAVTRTKDEAWAELEQLERRIKDAGSSKSRQAAFTEIAFERSECSSYMKNGDLGRFKSGQMQREFEDPAFALNEGEISGIVSTPSGLHLIMRTPLEPLSE
ncbi:MAG: hypothetical protein M1815_002587 [Lichina confinis]|nr:MAG: hypothetical protein M1815_002587 [Lichina confinis]